MAVAFVALGGAALVALFAMTRIPEEVHRTFDDYLKEARSATFPRPDNPPGWKLEDGAAADAYWGAHRKLETLQGEDPLNHDTVMVPFLQMASSAPSAAPAKTAAPPPECVALGVPETPSALGAALTAGLCERLGEAAVQEALVLLNQGCRRRDARGPGHLDDPMAYDGEQRRSLITFLKLAKLNLIQAHIDAAQGKHRSSVDRALCNVRFGLDFTHTYQLLHAMIGVAIHMQQINGLRALVVGYPDLARDPELIAYAADNLAWDRPTPATGARALKGEYLHVMSIAAVGPRDEADLPMYVKVARKELNDQLREEGGWLGATLINTIVGGMHPYYTGYIRAASEPPSKRRAMIQTLNDAVDASLNPMAEFFAPDFTHHLLFFDLIIDTHDRMILALADLHHQLTHDAEATTVEALVAATSLKTTPTCRFSNTAYTLDKTDACRALGCGKINTKLLRELDHNTGQEADKYATKSCLFVAPVAAAPPSDAPKPDDTSATPPAHDPTP